jgi:hypothetical protein
LNIEKFTEEKRDLIMGKIIVENFPSRKEVINLLDTFLTIQGFDKSYSLNNADNVLEILLKDYVTFL